MYQYVNSNLLYKVKMPLGRKYAKNSINKENILCTSFIHISSTTPEGEESSQCICIGSQSQQINVEGVILEDSLFYNNMKARAFSAKS